LINLACRYKARTTRDVAQVTAEGLKHLAGRWPATEAIKPLPMRLLDRTAPINKERPEFVLSLA
jgi:hypothetical protein